MNTSSNILLYIYEHYQFSATLFTMILFGIVLIYSIRLLVNNFLRKTIEKKYPKYSSIFVRKGLYPQVIQIFLGIYLIFCSKYLNHLPHLNEAFIWIKHIVVQSYVILLIMNSIIRFTNIIVAINKAHLFFTKIPVVLYAQIFKIITITCGILAIASTALGISISSLFTSLGAATAIFSFLFKDVLVNFVASLQITFQDVVRIGDWITIEQKEKSIINGVVEKITISLVVVRNFDGTTTTIPAELFLSTTVRNWRSISASDARSINRSIKLDASSVKICDQDLLKSISTLPLMQQKSDSKELFDTKTAATNLTLFKYYSNLYLSAQQALCKDDFSFLIRQSEFSSNEVLQLELHIFAKEPDFDRCDALQSKIIDSLTTILPKFGLQTF